MTAPLGIDFAWARPDPAAVYAAGYRFVMGYLSAGGTKDLTGPQIAAYRAAGLQVGLVWETTAARALAGASAGAADGAAAEAEANAVGYPPSCVIFAAVDYAATLAQIDGPIRAYMAAFSSATRRPVGVYGSYDVVSTLCTPGRAPVGYAWQTMAWSNSRLWQPAHLFQRLAHSHNIAGSPVTDWDEDVLLNPLPLFGAAPTPGGNDVPLTADDAVLVARAVLDESRARQPLTGKPDDVTNLGAMMTWSDNAHAELLGVLSEVLDAVKTPAPSPGGEVDPAALAAAIFGDPAKVDALGAAIARHMQLSAQ